MFNVEVTDEFQAWFLGLGVADADAVAARIELLAAGGPNLRRPVVGEIRSSRFAPRMKELRCGTTGAIRVLFTFDHRRTAILLVVAPRRATGAGGTSKPLPRPTASTRSILMN
jgi:hypothetical protein